MTEDDATKWKESFVYGAGMERISMTYLPAYDHDNGWEPSPGAGGADPDVTPKTLYYMTDIMGSTIGLLTQDGRLSARYHYDEFGMVLDSKKFDVNWPGPDNLYGYTGLEYDYYTNLNYARARYYKPEIGRFISEDTYKGTLWNTQSQNLYAYVYNNPLIYTDPSGNVAINATDGGGPSRVDVILQLYADWDNGLMGEEFFDLPRDIQETLKYIAKHRAISYGTQVPKKLLDFLILDDLSTIVDPNSSAFEKAVAGASITPWGKVVKIGGKVYRVASKGSDEAGYFAKGTVNLSYKTNDKTPSGLVFTTHGAQRANERGFTAQTIDNIVQNNKKNRKSKVDAQGQKTWEYTDARGNKVVLNESGGVIFVHSPADGGVYIPKPGK